MKESNYSGNFIVIEGPDGAGTTTQAEKLAEELDAHYTREPTDMRTGQKVQRLISSEDSDPLDVAEAFAEDRKNHLDEEVIPRLENGETVVSDRYYHSSLTYQPVMGADLEEVKEMNKEFLKPDLTLILEVDPEIGMSRVDDRGEDGHVFEQLSFQEKVSRKYGELDELLDEELVYIDSTKEIEDVFDDVLSATTERLGF